MTGRAPGANSRGRGGKFKKFTRGGGKHFSRDLRPLDADGNEVSMWSEDAQKKKDGSDSEEDEDEDESEEESDDGGASGAAAELSREERKREKKARKEAAIARAKAQTVQVGDLPPSDSEEDSDDDMPANPNHSKAARNQARQPLEEVTEAVKGLAVTSGTPSRRERESLEAQQAKERYRMLHEQGKTDEAKADLARLKVIREKREAENARKQAEKEAREAQEQARKTELEAKEAKKREAAMGPKGKKTKK
ncbi:casein kinase substrate phosphoprotein PP28-domain-containing protein [Phialemonium atrogriseum]|uniref:Casein kinase substrate phosphoprotein PP28-domain-containing protein n=1 Tax=Phialemonium atrogriseum TaxID=1093897 RepID=A0AAJ0BYA1_9PEZI|nr:casein kinase substrate phosphoprotein PP28-domain-containing protein [Phialemonium atrogriseum]KAK1766501.1 casein kinase substrate phosphoprotein PP28-domain-containing protein [Phialemonium atrogriseum]